MQDSMLNSSKQLVFYFYFLCGLVEEKEEKNLNTI